MKTADLSAKLFDSVLGAFDVLSVHIGSAFDLYRILHRAPRTSSEAAEAAGMNERYCREWLEQQAVAGLIDFVEPTSPGGRRRYHLSDEHAAVLADPDSLEYFTPFASVTAAAAVQLPALLEAYRTGTGVPWRQYGAMMRVGQAEANKPLFLQVLGSQWLSGIEPVHRALSSGGRIADIGCGDGWSSIGMALAYPGVMVDGYDIDPDSTAAGTAAAASHDVGDRVRFIEADVAGLGAPERAGSYDLVTAFECIHDMPDPVAVLAAARRLVRPGGTVLVMDERVPERFTGPGDAVEQLMYGMSLTICLPDGMSRPGSAATGTVMRPDTLRRYAIAAGFSDLEILDIEHDLFRLYRLTQ